MQRGRSNRRWCRAGALAVVSLLASRASAAADGAGGPLRDGNWAGTMAVGATFGYSADGVAIGVSGEGAGSFRLELAGGVATGEYSLDAASTLLMGGDVQGSASAVGGIAGIFDGTASAPILVPQAARFDVAGSVTVGDRTIPINVGLEYGPGEMLSSTLVIAASSCTVASGTWAQEFQQEIVAGGGSVVHFEGSWAARFAGATPGTTDAVLAGILARGEAILATWQETDAFDSAALEQVLLDAERYVISAPITDACTGADRGRWASPLAGLVRRLLFSISQSDSTTAEVFNYGIAAGMRTGVLPSTGGDGLEGELIVKVNALLDAAIASGATSDIRLIMISADVMGWTDVFARAAAAYEDAA